MTKDRWMDAWIDGCSKGWVQMHEWIDGYESMSETKNGWKNGWMKTWINGCMDRRAV